jgi:hypothetical protein
MGEDTDIGEVRCTAFQNGQNNVQQIYVQICVWTTGANLIMLPHILAELHLVRIAIRFTT